MATYTNEAGKTFPVHPKGNRFYYWSPRAQRLLPVARDKVAFS